MVKTKARLTDGPIFFRLFMFTLPIMLSGLLQVAYNMADSIVVGRFSGDDLALAATGSTASLVTLIVNILMGIATGVSVVIAQHFGAREHERVERATHTAMTFALISGICFAAVSILLSAPALELMGTKPELFDRALLYFRIICLGIPASTVYNFGSSVLRSVGDSRTPLYILFASGLVNVLFNLFFVIVCDMAVDGVAVATIISQYLSAAAVVAVLIIRCRESYGLKWKKLGIDIKLLARFLRFGVPTAISSSVFSVANVLITASANTLPTEALSARTIGGQVDNLVYVAMDAYTHSTMTFVAQNFGAGNLQRIKKTIFYSILQVTIVGIGLGQLIILLSDGFVSLFMAADTANRELVAKYATDLVSFFLTFYFMCGIMNTLGGILRGLGNSLVPMVVNIVGVCGLRLVWIYAFFPMEIFHTLNGLYICYPLTWGFCIPVTAIALAVVWRNRRRAGIKAPQKEEIEAK